MHRWANSSENSASSIDAKNLREKTDRHFDACLDAESLESTESLLIDNNDYFYSNDCNDLLNDPFDNVRPDQKALLHDAARSTASHFQWAIILKHLIAD